MILSAAAVGILIFLSVISLATEDAPVIYKNDTKYTITEYPVENVNGSIHVPVSFFIGLKDIQYVYNTEPAGFYLKNDSTGRYLSYSTDAKTIVADGSLTDISFPIANGTVYMPLEYCAELLSLKIEKKSGSPMRIRLTDGTHKLSFDELIELYDPTKTEPEKPPVIEPEKPIEQPEPPVTPTPNERLIYITFDSCPNEYTDGILDALDSAGIKGAFFFNGESMREYPQTVIRAFASGHSIGIASDTLENASDANSVLLSVMHFKTRVLRTEGASSEQASDKGYVLWNANAAASSESAVGAAKELYNKTFENKVTVASIPSDEMAVDVLKQLLVYLSDDEYITVGAITPTSSTETGGRNGN